jgi:hypothetical protein
VFSLENSSINKNKKASLKCVNGLCGLENARSAGSKFLKKTTGQGKIESVRVPFAGTNH